MFSRYVMVALVSLAFGGAAFADGQRTSAGARDTGVPNVRGDAAARKAGGDTGLPKAGGETGAVKPRGDAPAMKLPAEAGAAKREGLDVIDPGLVVRAADQLGLTAEQRADIQNLSRRAANQRNTLQPQLDAETAALNGMLQQAPTDQAACLAQLDKVLGLERQIKRLNLTLALAVREKLTAEQLAQLAQLRAKQAAGAQNVNAVPEVLRAKAQRLQEIAQQRQKDGQDVADLRRTMQNIKTLIQEGKFREANQALDQAIGMP
jgi:Spy/CpxP family protein refolding chaperone